MAATATTSAAKISVPSDLTQGLTLSSGHVMPLVGLGTWQAPPGVVGEAVVTALKAGYRHIDCAAVYGNEAEVGAGLKRAFDEGVVTREEIFITSKLWIDKTEPAEVVPAAEATLKDLGLEYVDLYLIHWPHFINKGASFPLSDEDIRGYSPESYAATWKEMEGLAGAGKARSIGVSNMSRPKLETLLTTAVIPPAVNQVELHPVLPQPDLVQWCMDNGIAMTAYSPLGNPSQAAKVGKEHLVPLTNPGVAALAEKLGKTPAQVLIRWNVQRGVVTIPKSSNPDRIAANFAVWDFALDAEALKVLEGLRQDARVVDGSFFCKSTQKAHEMWDEAAPAESA